MRVADREGKSKSFDEEDTAGIFFMGFVDSNKTIDYHQHQESK